MKEQKIKLGPAGTGGDSLKGLEEVKEAGLDSCEIEFTYGVRMSNALAKQVGDKAKALGIQLSIHAPYYINLNSVDRAKISASKARILQSCERGHYLGAKCIVFHAAFYGKDDPETVYQKVKEAVEHMQQAIDKNKWDVLLCPETTGKASQFGTVEELVRLAKETKCGICVDFAHLEARYNKKPDLQSVFRQLKELKHLDFIHSHFSGIEYTAKGERRHLITEAADIKELLVAMDKSGLKFNIINESPDPVGDAIKSKKIRDKL